MRRRRWSEGMPGLDILIGKLMVRRFVGLKPFESMPSHNRDGSIHGPCLEAHEYCNLRRKEVGAALRKGKARSWRRVIT